MGVPATPNDVVVDVPVLLLPLLDAPRLALRGQRWGHRFCPSHANSDRSAVSSATANPPFVFSPGPTPVAATGPDPLVNETRREIAEIVREVAAAAGSNRTADEFLTLLVDRILRAMAAEGVMVWRRREVVPHEKSKETDYQCVRRLGRITDQSIPATSAATHRRLLEEVAIGGQPVVVPATPGACGSDVPANPMEVPVALVAIDFETSQPAADYLLEVFLEPGCGVATQRGYLRFVAQMADLAGQFLRADQLRQLRCRELLSRSVDTAITTLHKIHDRRKLEAAIVDGAAGLFGFDRVGLCRLEPKVTLSAVSHVNAIDARSEAVRELRDAAMIDVEGDGCMWFEESSSDPRGDDNELTLRAVVESETPNSRRLVCLQSVGAAPVSSECRSELIRYLQHASLALGHATRLEAIPGGRLLASLAPAIESRRNGIWRPIAMSAAVMTLLVFAAFFPVPLVVYSNASIRPADIQTLASPRDAVVQQIHVRHGQEVLRGEKLLTMIDPALEEEITALVGRRAVLLQQQSRWTEALVDTSSNRLDRMEQVQGERSLVAEEIQSIDNQLTVLQRAKESLVIRADRNGIVDAWQIEQRLQSRPLRRGDPLLQVIAEDSPWVVDVQVPQSRIAHVQNADADENLLAHVSLEANPNESFPASLKQIGPAVVSDQGALPSTAVLLAVERPDLADDRQQTSNKSSVGCPGSGDVPLREDAGSIFAFSRRDSISVWQLGAVHV